jgi:DNA repair ATPase RecN
LAKKDVLTLGQASSIAGCSRDTIRRAAQKDDLRAEMRPGKKGQQWWIRQADLMDWLQARGKSVTPPATSSDQDQKVRELENRLADYAQQVQQAQQELSNTKQELRLAQQRATEAAEQLKTARGLVENWSGPRRGLSLRKLLGL